MGALLLLFLALSIKDDRTPLRSGCDAESDVVATLAASAPVTIRFAMSGESVPCYKVSVQLADKTVEGYLPATAINGLEEFDNARKSAAWLETAQETKQVVSAIRSSAQLPALALSVTGQGAIGEASRLIETSQPARALEILQPELRKKQNPSLLALAGVAAWRADDSKLALEYWKTALDMQPNPDLERIYHRVERETKGDQSGEKLIGMRVALRYDGVAVPVDTARQMLGALDDEYARISAELGCNAQERLVAIVQTRDAYRKSTDAAEWSAGQYDGRIRVPVLEGQGMDASMRRTLAHETTHACLSMLGRWPAWLQEGLAQKLSGDTLPPAMRQKIAELMQGKQLPRLENLGQDWSRLDSQHANAAYALSLAAVELLYENYAKDGVGNLIRNPQRLAQITADLDKRLGL
ncbi:MAG TPA: hypothetical protein VKR43_18985 [Bryobacteraceae bacterium]|nr:hypothetical protein [Bryobacteraceae bacterium]